MDKNTELRALAKMRQATRWPGYNCIADYHGGAYECGFVSPNTKTAGNVDAEIMVMLQDWMSDERMRAALHADSVRLGFDPQAPTNRNLIHLVKAVFGLRLEDIYVTNLFPFVKLGENSSSIPASDLIRAAYEFGMPQIRIVGPKLVICLGLDTFNALRRASNLNRIPDLNSAIENPFNINRARVWCQAHTGWLNNKGGVGGVSQAWEKMKDEAFTQPSKPLQQSMRTLVVQTTQSETPRRIFRPQSQNRQVASKKSGGDYFILNNKMERNHRHVYGMDDELNGVAIYDYDEFQAAHAFNKDFQEMRPGALALVFGNNLMVKAIVRVTGTKLKYADDLKWNMSVIYAEYFDTLVQPIRYRDFISVNRLSNPHLDPNNNFRRRMLVAHVC